MWRLPGFRPDFKAARCRKAGKKETFRGQKSLKCVWIHLSLITGFSKDEKIVVDILWLW